MILMYFQSSSSCSCVLASSGMSASRIDLRRGDLVFGSSCRLVPSGISGNNFALLHCTWFQLTSWISSHFPCQHQCCWMRIPGNTTDTIVCIEYWDIQILWCLWLTLWRMSSGITPSGYWKVLKLSLYTSLVLWSGGIFTLITEMHIGGNVILPLVFSTHLLVTWEMASAIISLLIVIVSPFSGITSAKSVHPMQNLT